MHRCHRFVLVAISCSCLATNAGSARADIGIGATPVEGAEMLIDGSREMLDEKWTYWKGPGFKSSLPIKWKIVDDPINGGTVVKIGRAHV